MQYAGFWRRWAALFIDAVIIGIPSLAVSWILPIGGLVVSILYKPIFEASPLKATPGKALMGISVVNEDGARISLKQAFIRYFASFLSCALAMAGYFISLFTARRQTLHDLIAETVVIHETAPTVNFFTIWLTEMRAFLGILETTNPPSSEIVSDSASPLATIEQLHRLLLSGAITEQDFLRKKEELLKKI